MKDAHDNHKKNMYHRVIEYIKPKIKKGATKINNTKYPPNG